MQRRTHGPGAVPKRLILSGVYGSESDLFRAPLPFLLGSEDVGGRFSKLGADFPVSAEGIRRNGKEREAQDSEITAHSIRVPWGGVWKALRRMTYTDPRPWWKHSHEHAMLLDYLFLGRIRIPNSSPSDLKTTQIQRGRWANNRLKDRGSSTLSQLPGKVWGILPLSLPMGVVPSAPSSPRPFHASWESWLLLRPPSTRAVPQFQ